MHKRNRYQPPAARRAGFTLVEILISVALVLILILGINEVFRLTSRAVGAGQALSDITRSARNAQTIIYNDITHADVVNGPFLFIKGGTSVAFRNREDQLSDRDFVVSDTNITNADNNTRSIDLTRSGTDTRIARAFMNRRNHRTDQLKLFTRTIARRQTGDNNSFTTGISSSEQYICYGHLFQPAALNETNGGHQLGIRGGNSTTYESPTQNPHNFYAADWVLGRNVFIMQEPDPAIPPNTSTPRYMYDYSTGSPVKVTYLTRGNSQAAKDSAAPFTLNSRSTNDGVGTNGTTDLVQYSHYDIAGFSMARYAADLPAFINNGRQNNWWNNFDYRFTGFPTPSKPLNRIGIARTVPCFLQHCTQFCVEFAGDFVAQDANTGTVTGVADGAGNGTDGQVDFFIPPGTTKRQIRWYGYPRDTSNNGAIRGSEGDVVPLHDIAGVQMKFERALPNAGSSSTFNYVGSDTTLGATSAYTCVWGPDSAGWPKPKMLRITMAIDDPTSRLGEEQYFEFIVNLQ